MSIETTKSAALVPEQCGMVCRLRYNQGTGKAELYFGITTPDKEVAFGFDYKECEELVRTLSHLMAQIPPSKR